MDNLQRLWNSHLRGLGIFKERLNLPDKICDVINEINSRVLIIQTLSQPLIDEF